jgi:ATP-binding cassette subfamily B protein
MVIPVILIILNYPLQLLITPICFIILFILYLRHYVSNLGPVTQQIRKEFGMMDAMLNETLTGIDLVKAMAREGEEKRKYIVHTTLYRDAIIKEGQIQAKFLPLFYVAIAVTVGMVHGLVLKQLNLVEIGQVISYLGLLANLRFPTNVSIFALSMIREAQSSAERLLETMNQTTDIDQNVQGLQKPIEGHIEFDHVSFMYPNSTKPVLSDISFEISAGQTIAIVGTTGSGKTTLTKLLSRLYDVTQGQILIDGIPIKDYSLEALRSQISYIEQDIFLFSTTLLENISFGRAGSKEEVIAAAQDAQANDFIMNLSQQYETHLGENGVQLSGGERQRIAIARAFLNNPRVLVLDDSTSAIDSETEEKIQIAIRRILKGRTTFLITHRLSQIRWADLILVLKRGQLIAKGNHKELLQTSEEYRNIFIKRFDLDEKQLLGGEI